MQSYTLICGTASVSYGLYVTLERYSAVLIIPRTLRPMWHTALHILGTIFDLLPLDIFDIDIYYACQTGIWLSVLYEYIVDQQKDSDYLVMGCHHFATLLLLSMSWHFGYGSWGRDVLWLHDITDLCIDLFKLSFKFKLPEPLLIWSYATAVLSWFYFRLWKFGLLICLAWNSDQNVTYGSFLCITLLSMLYTCHLFWFGLLIRAPCRRKTLVYVTTNSGLNESLCLILTFGILGPWILIH